MSAGASDAASAAETPAASRPRRMFRPARVASRLSGDEVAREGRIVRIAFDRLGSEAARQFASEDALILLGYRAEGLGLVNGASPA